MKRKKWTPYCRLPRRRQRDAFIRLRQKIRMETAIYGGLFTSHHVLDEHDRPATCSQWADVYFLGSDGLTIWNAEVITANCAFWDTVENMAHDRAWKLLTPEEQSAETEMKFEPIWSGGRRMYRLAERPKIAYEKFGGLSYGEYQDKLAADLIKDEPPEIFESFTTDRGYRYGIGLQMVIHVKEINRASVEEAIRRFRAVGEMDWRADQPVPRSELPFESAHAALECKSQQLAGMKG